MDMCLSGGFSPLCCPLCLKVFGDNQQLWENSPFPGGIYEFSNTVASATMSKQHTLQAIITGICALALKFIGGIAIAMDKLCSYGSLACYWTFPVCEGMHGDGSQRRL